MNKIILSILITSFSGCDRNQNEDDLTFEKYHNEMIKYKHWQMQDILKNGKSIDTNSPTATLRRKMVEMKILNHGIYTANNDNIVPFELKSVRLYIRNYDIELSGTNDQAPKIIQIEYWLTNEEENIFNEFMKKYKNEFTLEK
jgi:hypothetical protein